MDPKHTHGSQSIACQLVVVVVVVVVIVVVMVMIVVVVVVIVVVAVPLSSPINSKILRNARICFQTRTQKSTTDMKIMSTNIKTLIFSDSPKSQLPS